MFLLPSPSRRSCHISANASEARTSTKSPTAYSDVAVFFGALDERRKFPRVVPLICSLLLLLFTRRVFLARSISIKENELESPHHAVEGLVNGHLARSQVDTFKLRHL